MAEIIIETLSRDPYEFLYYIFVRGITVDVSQVSQDLKDNNVFFIKCLDRGDLDFYKWLFMRFSFSEELHEIVYNTGMIEYIKFMEDSGRIPRDLLDRLCVSEELNVADRAPAYTEWLIITGKASSIHPRVFKSLMSSLIAINRLDILERLLFVINTIYSTNVCRYVHYLLNFIADSDDGPMLLKMMARCGIFSTHCGQLALIAGSRIITNELNMAWRESCIPYKQELKLAVSLITRTDFEDHDVREVPDMCERLGSEISYYGMCILNSILMQCEDSDMESFPRQILASQMVLQSKFVPVFWEADCDSSIISDVTRSILIHGENKWITEFNTRMYNGSNREIYVKAANSVLCDVAHGCKVSTPRIITILQFLERDANLKDFFDKTGIHYTVVQYIIGEMELRHAPDLPRIADHLLSQITGEYNRGHIFMNNRNLIGDLTLNSLMYTIEGFDNGHCYYLNILHRVRDYARTHSREYVRGIVTRFIQGQRLAEALNLETPYTGMIYKSHSHLILGDRKYTRSLIDVNNIGLQTCYCIQCSKILGDIIYKKPESKHREYLCSNCKDDTTMIIDCLICLTSENPMKVLVCGHCVCLTCLHDSVQVSNRHCPMCRTPFPLGRPLTIEQVTTKFCDDVLNRQDGSAHRIMTMSETSETEASND